MTISQDRYPKDLVPTVEDFTNCGWQAVLCGAANTCYPSLCDAFVAAAKQALSEGQHIQSKILWLLAEACSMMLSPASVNEPFKPFTVFTNKRSIIPEDFLKADIDFFAQIVDQVNEPWLKARLADLVWFKQRPREVHFALAAIDSYRAIPLDTDTWWSGGRECWQRAISLARLLRTSAGDRVTEMEASIIAEFESTTRQGNFFGLDLAKLLESNTLGNDHLTVIATKLESLAREFEDEGNFYNARKYFQGSAGWYKASGDDVKSTEMTISTAECWVKEAEANVASDQPNHMAAAHFYENAIQTYRTIPRSGRAAHGVDHRIAELQKRLNDSGEKSMDEMKSISSPGLNISQIVENARNSVQGKSPVEALKAFANLLSFANTKELRKIAIKNLRNFPMQTLFPATVMSPDGRVIAKRPGVGNSATPSDGDEVVIRAEMSQHYVTRMSIGVQGLILPAQEVLLLEHRLREAEFIGLAHL